VLEFLQRLAWDPGAPVPAGWPGGSAGALLLFCIPGGLGIPPGVLLGARDGLGPLRMTALYLVSDVVLAALFEPMLRALAMASRRVPALARAGDALLVALGRTMPAGSVAGPAGVALTGFGAGLPFGRAVAAGAGYGPGRGWGLTIAGDLVYFWLGMASTLWVQNLVGDPRTAALAALALMLALSFAIRRVRLG
jgi:hypothetical protein